MAIANAYSSVDMESASVWYGTVTIATSTRIQVADGGYIQNYYGSNFTYSGDTVTGGIVTATDYYEFGSKVYDISGGAYSAVTVASYVNSGDMRGLFSYIFAGNDVFNGSYQDDVISGFAGNDSLYGMAGNDVLFGYSGDDLLYGGDGDDILDGEQGADFMDGGSGQDGVDYYGTFSGVSVDLNLGGYRGDATGDRYISIEMVGGSEYDDVIVGVAGQQNRIWGESGNDTIYGDGTDLIDGGLGNDVFFGGQAGALNMANILNIETIWASYASDNLDGTNFTSNLALIGQGPTADTLYGGFGNDFIYFRAGDLVRGGGGTDWAVATLSTSPVNLDLGTTLFEAAWGSTSADTLTATGSFTQAIMVGDEGNDTLRGGNVSDFLYGFGGNDRLSGGGGNDVLVGDGHLPGGAGGADTFVFATANQSVEGSDQIFYFTTGVDHLEFNATAFGFAPDATLGSQNFIANANPQASSAAPTFLYNTSNGLLNFDANGTEAGGSYLVAQFFQAAPVAAADFVFV